MKIAHFNIWKVISFVLIIGILITAGYLLNNGNSLNIKPEDDKSTPKITLSSDETPLPEVISLSPTPSPLSTFVHPVLKYSVSFPVDFAVVKTPTYGKYEELSVRSNDYKYNNSGEGYPFVEDGAEFRIFLQEQKVPMTLEEYYSGQPILKAVATNRKDLKVAGIDAIQYDFSYEGVMSVDTIFVKDNYLYTLRMAYANNTVKAKYLNDYQNFVSSFKLP